MGGFPSGDSIRRAVVDQASAPPSPQVVFYNHRFIFTHWVAGHNPLAPNLNACRQAHWRHRVSRISKTQAMPTTAPATSTLKAVL